MLLPSWTTLVGIACLAAGASACGGFHTSCGAASRVPLAPAGVYVDDDVADGYAAYAGALASAGRWDADATYGAHWCPARAGEEHAFRPYVSHGHWATSDQAAYGAPPGTPYWAADDAAPWTGVTTHRGWWIDLGLDHWCWVPGVQETPARVVWRSDDGFVGWAPEPPVWVDDGDESAAAGFEWAFELLGTLLEDGVDGYVLTGDAAQAAARATSPSGRPDGAAPGFSRRAPAKPVVDSARRQLVAYVSAHPNEGLAATAVATGRAGSSAPGSSSGSTGSSTGHRHDPDATKADSLPDHLPPASALVMAMMNDPMLGPPGVGRLAPSGSSSGSGGTGWSGGSPGGSHGAPAWTSSRGSSCSTSAHTWSHGPSVSSSGSSSSSHHGSSGSSGSSHSSSGSSSSHSRHK